MTLVTGDQPAPGVFSDDVTGHSPMLDLQGCDQLRAQLSDRRGGLTDVQLDLTRIEVKGATVTVDWRFAAIHTGAMLVEEDVLFEPSGRRVTLEVTSDLRFCNGRICSFEHHYDLGGLLRQLAVDPPD
jgi:hypothetical protein